MKKYKLIVLIIASNGGVYDSLKNIWKKYMYLNNNIKCFFVYGGLKNCDKKVLDNELHFNIRETYIPGILQKTIHAYKYVNETYEYTHILRTNLSSFYVFDRLLKFIEKLSLDGCYSAVQGVANNIKFGSGAGFILSKDLVTNLVKNKDKLNYKHYDDVSIGQYFTQVCNISVIKAPRYDLSKFKIVNEELNEILLSIRKISVNNFHFRIKNSTNRRLDPYIMEECYKQFYCNDTTSNHNMKLSHVVVATDLNELYCDFIPIFVRAWKGLFPHVRVCIILISSYIPDKFKEHEEYIILFNPIPGMLTAFQAQFIRILYPCLIKSKDGVLITDMDMIPMNKYYYEECIKEYDNSNFICYRNVLLNIRQLPICYNIATPKVWRDIFNVKCENDLRNVLKDEYNKINYDGKHGGKGWSTDQIVLYNKVMEWNKKTCKLVIINDNITKFNRLDRIYNFNLNDNIKKNIRDKNYSDYHMKRPYIKYKEINDNIVNELLK